MIWVWTKYRSVAPWDPSRSGHDVSHHGYISTTDTTAAVAGPETVALLVLIEDYQNQAKLKNPVASGVKLAEQLQARGYKVTVIAGAEEKTLTMLKDKPGKANKKLFADVQAAGNGVSLESQINEWCEKNLSRKLATPVRIGILAVAGHGGILNGRQYLYTTQDKFGEGGVDLDAVREMASDKDFPLVMIVDSCRSTVDPKEGAKPNANDRGPSTFRLGLASQGTKRPTTTLYSGAVDKTVPDEKTLLHALANQLAPVPGDKKAVGPHGALFYAQKSRFGEPAELFLTTGSVVLTLFEWFAAAMAQYQEWKNLAPCEMHWGSMGQSAIVALNDIAEAPAKALPDKLQLATDYNLLKNWFHNDKSPPAKLVSLNAVYHTDEGKLCLRLEGMPGWRGGALHPPISIPDSGTLYAELKVELDDVTEGAKVVLSLRSPGEEKPKLIVTWLAMHLKGGKLLTAPIPATAVFDYLSLEIVGCGKDVRLFAVQVKFGK